jgi:predicted amidohydrolase YtcJ
MPKAMNITFLAAALLISACDGANQRSLIENADLVLTGGRIYTEDARNPWAQAVAIQGKRFVYVGDDRSAEAYVGESTERIDLGGRLVLPGLIDGHTHPGMMGIERYGPSLPDTGHEDLLAAVKAYADSAPDEEWIRMCCWSNAQYVDGRDGPNRRDLDAIVPDRPVWITSLLWHSYWLNSKALETLRVDENTPDPRPGIASYVRDENGELTGWVKEGAGWQHFAKVFTIDPALHRERVTEFLNILSEHGVTTVFDGGNLDYEDEVYGLLSELEKSGKLPLRYEGTYMIYLPERRHLAVQEMKRLSNVYGGERLRFRTIKLFMDGINSNRSGGMLEPYADDPDYVGNTMLTVGELRDFLLELHQEKFDLHVHAIGDLAVRTVLDAVEAAKAMVEGDLYPRVTIAHLEIVDPADWPRFAKLGVTANFTAWWHAVSTEDPPAVSLGEERAARTFIAKPLFDSGANVTFSSDDWTPQVLSPFLGMQVGHNRQSPGEPQSERGSDASAFLPPASERLDLELMLKGYTINGAYPFRMEDQIGSIESGKLADLVVLDENLFDMNRSEIHKIKPLAVMMEGEFIRGGIR